MPKRKSCIGRSTTNSKKSKLNRSNETPNENEVRLLRNYTMRNNANTRRTNETVSTREARTAEMRINAGRSRANESLSNREARTAAMRNDAKRTRADETISNREVRLVEIRNRAVIRRQTHWADLNSAAFHYDSEIDYQ